MYTMIATLSDFYLNINNVYMTLMMVAPMALVMLVAMRTMFPSDRMNLAIRLGAVIVFAAGFIAMRTQAAVGNEQFLRSMIPHHSGAILMCEQSSITDPEISTLCDQIIRVAAIASVLRCPPASMVAAIQCAQREQSGALSSIENGR